METLHSLTLCDVLQTLNFMMKEFSKEQHIGADVIADIANWILKN